MLKACIGLKQVDSIDRRHSGLTAIPEDIYRHERTLEDLILDYNGIQELPPVSRAVQTRREGGYLPLLYYGLA